MPRIFRFGILLLCGGWVAGCANPAGRATASGRPAAPPGFHWEAVPQLTDEFRGAKLDGSKWLPYLPYWNGRPPSRFSTNNVTVGHGYLGLSSTPMVTQVESVANPNKDIWIHSACVASRKPIASYGYYAARVKASRLPMTSSFWFQGKYSEIDVVEEVGASQKIPGEGNLMLMNTHFFRGGWKEDKATPRKWRMPTGAADDFHVYGAWWKDKDTVWFYHDGEKVAEAATGGEFLEAMYLFFDTEVFSWEGLPTVEMLADPAKNTMRVEWVRAWRLAKDE